MPSPCTRRLLLRQALGLGLAGLSLGARPRAAGAEDAGATPTGALAQRLQECRPPGDPLEALLAGNRRFAALWRQSVGEPDPQQRMARLAELWRDGCQADPAALRQGQRPRAAVLTCADSRLAPQWLFACGPGELFEVRAAGNTAFATGIASLEYAVAELAVPLILVLGHSGCGAVTAAMADAPLTPLLQELMDPIRACLRPGMDLQAAIEANARASATSLVRRSALLAEALTRGRLTIAAAVVDLASGRVRTLAP